MAFNRETYPRAVYGDWEFIHDVDEAGKLIEPLFRANGQPVEQKAHTLARVYGKDGSVHVRIGTREEVEAFAAEMLEATKKKEG